MPHSPSPDRSYDRRGPPKDWDAPEEEDGEISYTGNNRRSGPSGGGYRDSRAGGGGGRDRDRSRDRRDYRDRAGDRGGRRDDYNRGHRDNDAGGRRDHRDRDRSDRDRDRDRGGRDRDRDERRRRSSRSRSPYRRGRSRSKSPRGGRRGNRDDKDDKDDEEGSYRRRRDDNMDESDDEKDKGKSKKGEETVGDTDKPLEELTPEEQEARMMAMMGFGGFDSTKGKKVAGADVSGVDIKKQRQYRQYMNRRGGFNRPLDSK